MTFKRALAAIGALAASSLATTPALAQNATTAQLEQCTTWGFIQDINYEFGVVNTCAFPIDVWFLSGTHAQVHGQVAPGGTFSTGLTTETADINQWVSAVCLVGYQPSPSVTIENADAIVRSQYTCVSI